MTSPHVGQIVDREVARKLHISAIVLLLVVPLSALLMMLGIPEHIILGMVVIIGVFAGPLIECALVRTGSRAGQVAQKATYRSRQPLDSSLTAQQPTTESTATGHLLSWKRLYTVSGCVAASAFTIAVFHLTLRDNGETYVSQVGELRRVKLEDGSSMILNTASRVLARFDESQREVQLLKGEALFEVAKDRSRVFVVHVDHVAVKAVGTAFAVRRGAEHINVMVTEGVVELSREDGAADVSVQRLTANQLAEITGRALRVQTVSDAEAQRRLAWRRGMVELEGQSLSEAIEEFNRHSNKRIVVEDPALARRPIIGIFRTTDTHEFAQTAAAVLGAEAIDDGDMIRIRSKTATR